jgi:hypothetical protein
MKVVIEIVLSLLLHPIAFVLMIINVLGRQDLNRWKKTGWILVGFLWGLGPLAYVFLGDGALW